MGDTLDRAELLAQRLAVKAVVRALCDFVASQYEDETLIRQQIVERARILLRDDLATIGDHSRQQALVDQTVAEALVDELTLDGSGEADFG